jgi:hypothetical protein
MSLIIPANSAAAAGGYAVDNSCRFNDGSSDNLSRTTETPTNAKKYTFSVWVKRSNLGAANMKIFGVQGANANEQNLLEFNADDLVWQQTDSSGGNTVYRLKTDRKFRDSSAWYHIVVAYDSSQGTANNRIRMYINGVEETSFSTRTNPSTNLDSLINSSVSANAGRTLRLGRTGDNGSQYFDGYMSEVCFIDGQQLTPTSFGEFDEDSGIWKPIDGLADDLTFGNNGFYLDFEDSGALGADVSGNTNNFTVNNLTAIDQTTDTPTNNFCTWNPLDTFYSGNTYQEGNTQGTKPNDSVESFGTSTFGMSSGKWYAEFKVISFSGSNSTISFGIIDRPSVRNDMQISKYAYGIAYLNNGYLQANDGATHNVNTGTTFGAGDIIGVYIDIDNLEIYFAKNGTILNSGTGLAIQPLSSTANGVYFFAFDNFAAGGSVHQANWGNPAYTGTDQADANGYGSFEYSPSAGTFDSASKDFYALNTKNLAEYG